MKNNSQTHLLIDIGNSRIKWALCTATEQADASQLLMHNAFEHSQNLDQQCQQAWGKLPLPKKILVSSVASDENYQALSDWCYAKWEIEAQRFYSQSQFAGVHNAYADPTTLGADRWAGLIAAHAIYKDYVLVADCGTAITIDILGAEGQHLGGYILPGLIMMRNALQRGTYALPPVDDVRNLCPADNTHDAIAAGTALSVISTINNVSNTISQQIQQSLTIVITGGNAEAISQHLTTDFHLEPHLVLKGLAIASQQKNTLQ